MFRNIFFFSQSIIIEILYDNSHNTVQSIISFSYHTFSKEAATEPDVSKELRNVR